MIGPPILANWWDRASPHIQQPILFLLQTLFFFATSLQRKLERRAGTIIGYRPKAPAVVLYNRTADRESHPHSLRLGGVESIEDLFEILPNRSQSPESCTATSTLIGFVRRGSNKQLPRSIRDRIHGFDTVHHQIKNHLLQLDSIAQYRRDIGGQVHAYRHSFSHRFILHQKDDFLNGLVNVEPHFLGIGFLYESSNARDHLACPIAIADNAAHGVAALHRGLGSPRQASAARHWRLR